MQKIISVILFSLCWIFSLSAQIQADANISFVNQNIWRGAYQAGTSIQPEVNISYKNWNFQIWGTSDFKSEGKEIDLSIGYDIKNFNIGFTDYWFGGMTDAYLKKHILENNLSYTFPDIFLSIEWNTVLMGCNNNHPVFQRIVYSPRWYNCEYEFSIGYSPWKNELLNSQGFAINELSATIKKEIGMTHNLKLYLGSSLIYNPYSNNLFFACKIGAPLTL